MKDERSTLTPIETLAAGAPEEEAGPAEAPIQQTQRLPALDVLRGFALLGILMINVEAFAGPEGLWGIPVGLPAPAFMGWHSGLDYAIVVLKWMFVEGKHPNLLLRSQTTRIVTSQHLIISAKQQLLGKALVQIAEFPSGTVLFCGAGDVDE
jgi:hypothetical protein